ncbi:hypothetical protein JZ785_07810 [Alicyclobacillus curvatus]|nr:hypothetical protein JZ785_07810 [Alicyclobacillus curvatus]
MATRRAGKIGLDRLAGLAGLDGLDGLDAGRHLASSVRKRGSFRAIWNSFTHPRCAIGGEAGR